MMKLKDASGSIISDVIKTDNGAILPNNRKDFERYKQDRIRDQRIASLESRLQELSDKYQVVVQELQQLKGTTNVS